VSAEDVMELLAELRSIVNKGVESERRREEALKLIDDLLMSAARLAPNLDGLPARVQQIRITQFAQQMEDLAKALSVARANVETGNTKLARIALNEAMKHLLVLINMSRFQTVVPSRARVFVSRTPVPEEVLRLGPLEATLYSFIASRGRVTASELSDFCESRGISLVDAEASMRRLVDSGLVRVTYEYGEFAYEVGL